MLRLPVRATRPKRGPTVAPFCDEGFKHFAFVVNGAPQVVALAVDPDKDLIEVPAPVRVIAPPDAPLPYLGGRQGTKPVPPVTHRLVADVDAAFEKDVFDLWGAKYYSTLQNDPR